jgi:2-keto-4-pentenoate hydratase/2-oxohepta-3-ene-1,7-dioic acid hydratase in catechol pathway
MPTNAEPAPQSLKAGDRVTIGISGIGTLSNSVQVV